MLLEHFKRRSKQIVQINTLPDAKLYPLDDPQDPEPPSPDPDIAAALGIAPAPGDEAAGA